MGVHNADGWSRALLDRGKSPQTPVAIVRRSSWPDQEVVRCTLADVTEIIEKQKILPPAVIAVGEAVGLTPERSWFSSLPLFGISVLVTRPKERDDELANILRGRGAEVLFQPAIAISDPPDWRPLDAALARLPAFDWLVFSSGNGVRYFFGRLFASGCDARRLGGAKIAAIGPNTAEELFNCRIKADLVPDEYRAEALADALAAQAAGRKFLLIRASRGREVLAERLVAAGSKVEQVVAYSSVDVESPDEAIAERLASGRIDWITVTSSSIARSLENLFGEDLRKAKIASISPVTSAVLRELGHEPSAEARQFTPAGLAEAILEAEE
jgi:uroporphyrinogen III methyltransferase/synthase